MARTFYRSLKAARRRKDLLALTTVHVRREQGRVREAATDPLAAPLGRGSLADIPFDNARQMPRHVALRRRTAQGWVPVTAAEFAKQVAETAKGLIQAGLQPGGRVALMSRTRYEWAVLDFAIWAAGGQTVPVYPTSSAVQLEWILEDSGAQLAVAEDAANADVIKQATMVLDRELPVWVLEEDGLARLAELSLGVPDEVLAERRARLTPETIATLVYTSGTTGRPKGCVITHGALHAEAANLVALLVPAFQAASRQDPSTLMFLPLAHVLGRVLEIACLQGRMTIGLWPSIKPDEVRPELEAFKPTFLCAVPYFFERIHDIARATAEKIGRASSFDRADRIAVRYGDAQMDALLGRGKGPGFGLRFAHGLYDLLVYRRVRAAMGGNVRYVISGSSRLDARLASFFFGCGVLVYEGYGLTETSAAATVNPPLEPRAGTVGVPIPGGGVRIEEDGEILLRGPILFSGYWLNDAATAAAMHGEWFATGDLGDLDEDGYLTITGRKKDILITSGGKNVSPSLLEDRLRSRPPVGQCMVVGDGRHYVVALVTLELEEMEHWLSVRKRPLDTPFADLARDPELLRQVQAAVDYANEAVSRAESIRAFTVVEGEFTEENGLLTPSLKVKRHAVADAYAQEIEDLYAH
ncbi:AMP-binding protein [Actinospica durhamensis]|uniref:AMP-binding protein n=1 Tax=Actinospica durhamensis TaxID=1508375 RepID=A0A941EWI5_9ACTN|nr:AMP-dependent synthetase/ligase [Actinospica durhamensis]MBR7839140.1 AMP-binding protein [Actinospica durhamensis]